MRSLVNRMFNAGTEKQPDWRQVSYMIAGECLRDRLPDKNAHELAIEKTQAMLLRKEKKRGS